MERLRLSDTFTSGTRSTGTTADVEVRVHVLNINYGYNRELMERCPLLGEYSRFVAVSREYLAKGLERQEAYEAAIDYCIEHDILRKILRENRMEVIGMLLREFDVEKYERSLREEGQIRVSELFRRLLSQDCLEELAQAANDIAYQEKLLREMGI